MSQTAQTATTKPWQPDYSVTPQRIVCAACQHKDGAVIIGIRHMDTIMHDSITIRREINPDEKWHGCDQGFVDQFGNFLSRQQAWVIAVAAKQIYRLVGNQTNEDLTRNDIDLYSENLY